MCLVFFSFFGMRLVGGRYVFCMFLDVFFDMFWCALGMCVGRFLMCFWYVFGVCLVCFWCGFDMFWCVFGMCLVCF